MISTDNRNPFKVPQAEASGSILQLDSSQFKVGAVLEQGGIMEPRPLPATVRTPLFSSPLPRHLGEALGMIVNEDDELLKAGSWLLPQK